MWKKKLNHLISCYFLVHCLREMADSNITIIIIGYNLLFPRWNICYKKNHKGSGQDPPGASRKGKKMNILFVF